MNEARWMQEQEDAADDGVDVSLLSAAGGAEVVDRFLNTPSEMNRPNWAANLAVLVYRAMRRAELSELHSPAHTKGSAPEAGTRLSDPGH